MEIWCWWDSDGVGKSMWMLLGRDVVDWPVGAWYVICATERMRFCFLSEGMSPCCFSVQRQPSRNWVCVASPGWGRCWENSAVSPSSCHISKDFHGYVHVMGTPELLGSFFCQKRFPVAVSRASAKAPRCKHYLRLSQDTRSLVWCSVRHCLL